MYSKVFETVKLLFDELSYCNRLSGLTFVIAGGAARDVWMGLYPSNIKDIDVFVDLNFGDVHMTYMFGPDWKLVVPEKVCNKYGFNDVLKVYEAELNGFKVQFIVLDHDTVDTTKVVNRFDMGLCMCYFHQSPMDGEKPGVMAAATYAASCDALLKQFTVHRCSNIRDARRTYRRYLRISQKYPGFTFNPGAFAELFKGIIPEAAA